MRIAPVRRIMGDDGRITITPKTLVLPLLSALVGAIWWFYTSEIGANREHWVRHDVEMTELRKQMNSVEVQLRERLAADERELVDIARTMDTINGRLQEYVERKERR